MKDKLRLDMALLQIDETLTRQKAAALIMAGNVYIDNQKATKAGTFVTDITKVEIRGEKLRYVSRGGLKLERAIDIFSIDLNNSVCMDIGASTGGFTDCMLQNGAELVYAVDVGYGQLDYSLRIDKRVVNLERTNIRHLDESIIEIKPNFISIDVSFISLKLVLPKAFSLISDSGEIVALVKPQFEAGKNKTDKGVVRDIAIHREVVLSVCEFVSLEGFVPIALDYSPVKGPKGNIEYLLRIRKDGIALSSDEINTIVNDSHIALNGV